MIFLQNIQEWLDPSFVVTHCVVGREPGLLLRMFFATFFSLLFLIVLYLGPSQVGNDHPQLGPVWSQGPKNTLFGKRFWRNDVIVNIKALHLHKWSYNHKNVHGVSWHIGETSRKRFWGLLPFCCQIWPSTLPKTQKNVCPPDKLSSKVIIFKHFIIHITASNVCEKLPKVISFNLSPRWPFYQEDYSWYNQSSPLYLKSEKTELSYVLHINNILKNGWDLIYVLLSELPYKWIILSPQVDWGQGVR